MGQPKYEDVAEDPGTWRDMAQLHRITADHLHEHLWSLFERGDLPGDRERMLAFFRAYVLHAALALELAAKAVQVKRNPKVVVGGKLELPGRHDLMVLVPEALGRSPKAEEKDLLQRYTHAVTWFARYPVPKKEATYTTAPRQGVSDDDRVCFDRLMNRLLSLSMP
jgi:hypothetical protein